MKIITLAAVMFASFSANANLIDNAYKNTAFISGAALACYNEGYIPQNLAELMVDTHIAKLQFDLDLIEEPMDDDRIMESTMEVAAMMADKVNEQGCSKFEQMLPEITQMIEMMESVNE
ncbi:MAG: hypothetical protein ACRCWQ_02780 [Bacilli bacterium]